jgi:serine/threonine protein kinase
LAELQPDDPARIGPYELLGRLGSGGMGHVFLGRSPGRRLVAVKVIRPELAEDARFRARFAREVAAARTVGGLYTAQLIDAELDGQAPWLVTAYVPGPSLADAVAKHGPLPGRSVAALATGLAEGLSAIHAAGVIHRDLKPSNVLLAADGPRIIDFGIASAAQASSLTGTGFFVGSPGYMSPEQAQGHVVGPASDIFSLGSVLWFAATGEGPFGAGDTPAMLYRVVHVKPDYRAVPDEFRPLIGRCLAKDPARRPSAAQFLADLTAAHPDSPDLAGDWLPPQMLAGSTWAVQASDGNRHEPASPAASGHAAPEPAATNTMAAPRDLATAPAQAGAQWPSPAHAVAVPKSAVRRRRWPWVAAGGTACAAVIATLVISLGTRPGSGPAASGSTPATSGSTPATSGSTPAASGSTPAASGSTPASSGSTPAVRHLLLSQLRTGDCLTGANMGLGTDSAWPTLTTAVPCGQQHLAEVFFAQNAYWPGPYPGDSAITQQADAQCARVFTPYVGVSESASRYTHDDVFPDATDWSNGERELICVAYLPASGPLGAAPITGSVKGTGQ